MVVEFLATKENDYNANICYFKVVDGECKSNMKSIIGLQDDDIRMPFWKTVDKQYIILKVKDKFVNAVSDLVIKGLEYAIDMSFESYNIEQEDKEPIKGYYSKVSNVKPLKAPGLEILENDWNWSIFRRSGNYI